MEGQIKNKNGFTMVSDYIAWKYQDYLLAVVYAKIERFCNLGKDRICDASVDTLKEELVVRTNTTIEERIDLLEKEGYIIDSTPNLVNRTHNRTVTEKLQKEETEFQEWAEMHREKLIAQGSKLPSYYDCFVEYATQQKINSYLSKISKPKKPRGKNGGRKKKSEIKLDYSEINQTIASNQPLINQYSTIDYDNTLETSETNETLLQTSENSEGRTSSSFPPASVEASLLSSAKVRDSFSLKEAIEECGDSLFRNNNFPLQESNFQIVSSENSSETIQEVEKNKLASSDIDTSSESIEKRVEKLLASQVDRSIKARVDEEYGVFYSFFSEGLYDKETLELLRSRFVGRLQSYGY